MRPRMHKILCDVFIGLRTLSSAIWATLTSTALLTMMIALGTLATDAEIDNLVYELYGITGEERKIIEGGL